MRALMLVALLVAACAGNEPVGPGEDGGAMPQADGGAAGAPDAAPGPSIGDCSNFATIDEHFAYLNQSRIDYEPHERYRGIAWQGEYHNMVTFPITFTWSDALATTAQAEAARVAAGGAPIGVLVPGQNGENRDMWISGLGTASWRITAIEQPGDWEVAGFGGHEHAALHPSNGSARMDFFYHDFGGTPVITRMGVGGVATADCRVVWVLQMGE